MRVGVQARELAGTGGTHAYLRGVLPRLAERVDGELVCVHAGGESSPRAHVAEPPSARTGTGVTHVDSWTDRPLISDHLVVPALLRDRDVDVAWYPKNVLPPAHRGPSVVTMHDLGHFVRPEFYPALDRVYQKAMIRYAARAADRIVAVSERTKADLLRYTAADADRIEVIHHGVDERFRATPSLSELARVHEKYDLAPTTVYGGNVGRRKNVCRLVEAFEAVASRTAAPIAPGPSAREDDAPPGAGSPSSAGRPSTGGSPSGANAPTDGGSPAATATRPGIELVFTGPPPEGRQARTIAARENVRHLGYVPTEDLPALYHASAAFVYPSLYEGFGLPPLEAMACETPVVASNAAAIPEVVGDAALLVDPRDASEIAAALERALTDERLRNRLVDAGRTRSREFSWRTAARRLATVFETVVDERGPT